MCVSKSQMISLLGSVSEYDLLATVSTAFLTSDDVKVLYLYFVCSLFISFPTWVNLLPDILKKNVGLFDIGLTLYILQLTLFQMY